MIHTPEMSAKIFDAIESIELSNNGWSWVENDATLIKALRTAGYIVFEVRGCMKAFTRAAQESLASESFARRACEPAKLSVKEDAPDFEAKILSRQERWMMSA